LLRERHADSHGPWVFPPTAGTLRDPDNTRKQLRQVLASSEWKGLHSHAFRHLVATRLDATGVSAREIADYLGRERVSMTQDRMPQRTNAAASARPQAQAARSRACAAMRRPHRRCRRDTVSSR
jgi:integrase